MKNIFVALILLFLSLSNKAQNNLQFNRAVLVNIAGSHSVSTAYTQQYFVFKDTNISVPAGKVWKLESASVTLQNSNPTSTTNQIEDNSSYMGTYLLLNNKIISQKSHKTSGSGGDFSDINLGFSFPIWLPTGTYPIRLLFQSFGGGSTTNVTGYGGMSILEFNIVQ